MPKKDLMLVSCRVRGEMSQSSANIFGVSGEKVICCVLPAYDRSFFCLQGSYWAIDTNPKEDALPTRPKKRPRSGERVSVMRENTFLHICCSSAKASVSISTRFRIHLRLCVSTSASVFFSVNPAFSPTLSLPHTNTHTDSVGVHIQTLCNCLSMLLR